MTRPIQLKTHTVLIDAPCEMVFQKLSSFGSGRMAGDNTETAKVVSRDGNTIVAEFYTKVGPFTYTIVEEVTLDPPGVDHVQTPVGAPALRPRAVHVPRRRRQDGARSHR